MPEFKIAAAQVASVRGDLDRNVATHAAAIGAAALHGVSVLVFPELSLTGYEPELAAELAIEPADERLLPIRTLARRHGMDLVVGAPVRHPGPKPFLGAIRFAADGVPTHYAKMHLGAEERTFFEPGTTPARFTSHGRTIGLAICADASQPSHAQSYADAGATIYAAGVFLNAEWYETDTPRLAGCAARHRMLVMMANHGASVGTYTSVGSSAVWGPDGERIARADGVHSSLVIATGGRDGWRGEVVTI